MENPFAREEAEAEAAFGPTRIYGDIIHWRGRFPSQAKVQEFFEKLGEHSKATGVIAKVVTDGRPIMAEYTMVVHDETAYRILMHILDSQTKHRHVLLKLALER